MLLLCRGRFDDHSVSMQEKGCLKKIARSAAHVQLLNQKRINEEYDDKTFNSLAHEFASKVAEQVFSPAEVLSCLLERKKSPLDTVSCVESWVANAKY
ncbi:hypothetical protein N7493_008802 [Penicillium malachiteum]|uniref:Mitochondrial chaperone BCS1-like ATPase lid domain-containing protein n=1 Tax=Penicillium malachiteum TaxID=1324776 RepID=A0AAD6HF97_9EURO|nr:hypothetical protein N7493_008802 [Penicillium malachiteum]